MKPKVKGYVSSPPLNNNMTINIGFSYRESTATVPYRPTRGWGARPVLMNAASRRDDPWGLPLETS